MYKIYREKTFRLIFLFLILLMYYLIFTATSSINYGKIDEKAHSDVAIILGAGTSNGEVSLVYRERINQRLR